MGNDYSSIIVYIVFFFTAGLFSFLINGLFLKFTSNLGIRNTSETIIRWGSTSKPAIGGVSFYIIFLFSIVIFSIFFNGNSSNVFYNIRFIGILLSVTMAFLMGLADDAYNTKPFLKFIVQFLCGIILIYTGTYIKIFSSESLNYAITILWIVGMMNSINMLDNMDAITSVVSITIILSALTILFLMNEISGINAFILIGVLASLLGFLFYNWHPSKIYMGDTGSQFLGCFLGVIGIIYFWNNPSVDSTSVPSKQLLSAVLIFIIPIVDTTTVTIARLLRKQSPFVGGKDHTTHHLSYMGLSDRQVALTFLLLSLFSLSLVLIINSLIKNWGYLHILIFSSYILLVFISLFTITRIYTPENRKKKNSANQT